MLRSRPALLLSLAAFSSFCFLTSHVSAQASSPAFTVLYAFDGYVNSGDGFDPTSALVIGANGVLYGTTYQGGLQNSFCPTGCGTVFSLTPTTQGFWTETQIHRFSAGDDGSEPDALAISPTGVLYGTTAVGSPNCLGDGCGTVFSLTSLSGSWTKDTFQLRKYSALPDGLHIGANGLLFGTSQDGGSDQTCFDGCGAIWVLRPPSNINPNWAQTLLHSFPEAEWHPLMSVVGPGGVIFGTTEGGDSECPSGCGTVFSLKPPTGAGGAWTANVLDSFVNLGSRPFGAAGIVLGKNGTIYGTTSDGGEFNLGAVFSLRPPTVSGGPWIETLLYSFQGPPDGANPNLGLVMGADGTLYGTTYYGGDANCYSSLDVGCGAVFSLSPPAAPGGSWTETVLHAFSGGEDGGIPVSGVTIGPNGVLYGTTTAFGGNGKIGTIYAIKP